jgi:hypothetical protein
MRLTKLETLEARKAVTLPTSSGAPIRPKAGLINDRLAM